ncbi:MAG TPA: siphovirus ReqiPepy6 Gp37-like family protein [Clostridia bacterium]
MEIYVFNTNFNFQGIVDNFSSFTWTRKYYSAGEFELHVPLTSDNLTLLSIGNIICKKDNKDEAAYIEYRELGQSEGIETLIVKGFFLSKWFSRRITWNMQIQNIRAEVAMKNYVNLNCISSSITERNIPNLVVSVDKGLTPVVSYSSIYKSLYEELSNISRLSDLGYRIIFKPSTKQYIFDVNSGRNLTVNQSTNSPAIFSINFDNVLEQTYTDSTNNYANTALVGGQGEDINRKLVTVNGNNSGLNRFEIFVDASDIGNDADGNPLPDATVTSLLTDRGNQSLSDMKENQTFDAKINVNSNLRYMNDFDLGDIVTVTNQNWGITLDTRITTIEEVYENNGLDIRVTFGNNIPTLIDKIKQKIK